MKIKIGFIVNPISGMGGRVGLKGTDGVFEKSLELGAKKVSPKKAKLMLDYFISKYNETDRIKWLTCSSEMGENEKALKNYDLAILNTPEDGEVFFKRGIYLFEIENYAGAMEDFNYAIKLDNSIPAPYTNRGLLKLELKDKAGACEDWKKAFQLGSEYAQQLLKKHCK